MWPNGPIRHGDARCKSFRLLKKTWKLHSLYVVVEIQRVSPRCVRYRLVSWCYGTLVPRQLQRTTWLTSTGYCRSKHTHAHTDFSGTSLHWSLTQFTPASMEVGDLRYANFPGIRFTEVSGKFLLLAASVETCLFFWFFEKQSSGCWTQKTGGKLGIRDSFCKWCTELCFNESFRWSVYLILLAANYFLQLYKADMSRCCWSGFRKIHWKKQLLCFVAANMFLCRDTGGCVYLLVVNPSRTFGCEGSPSFSNSIVLPQNWAFFCPETQVHPQNVWERYFSILVGAPQEILGRGWWVLVVDGWSKGVHGFPFLGLKHEIGDVFLDPFCSSRRLCILNDS